MADQSITIYFTGDEYKKLENAASKELREPTNFAKYYTLKAADRFNDDFEESDESEEDFVDEEDE